MGTNYYWHSDPQCEHCLRESPPIHIGKSSFGWGFSLHVYPHEGGKPKTFGEWCDKFQADGSYIVDEYGCRVTADDMRKTITDRSDWESPERGTLKRHDIDGSHCISRGEGDYDLCVGSEEGW